MTAPRRSTPAAAFLPLLLPFGVSAGYASVTLGFLLAKSGMPTAAVAALVAFSIWPQTWKVFWAPLVDTVLTPRAWHVIGSLGVGLSILALSVLPVSGRAAPVLTVLIVVSSLASTLVSMSSEVFMAHGIEDERKGAVSGWSQAGNLGGSGLGGGLGLYLAQNAGAPWVSGAVLASICIACSGALLLVRGQVGRPVRPRYLESLRDVGVDLWAVARSRAGLLVLVLMLLPIGSGGAAGVWSAIAGEWRVGGDTVALVSGVLGGLASLVGALAAGWICDRLDRKLAYCLFGLALAAVAVAWAMLPRLPVVFITASLAYSSVLGACYAGYSAAVLEAIGKGAAATKFNLLAAASNIPIATMTTVDGALHDRFGSSGMFFGEAGLAVAAIAAFVVFAEATRNRGRPRGFNWRI